MNKIKDTIKVYKAFFAFKTRKLKERKPKGKRFWGYCYIALILPWALVIRYFRKNPRLLIWFAVWFVIVSCEVWFPYLMGAITWGTEASGWWFGIGSACWLFWAGPGTPFMAIVLALTIATEAVFQKINNRRRK